MKKKKKGVKREAKIQVILILLTIILITFIYYFVPPTFIGYTILEKYKVDITNSSNFNYNDTEIEIVNGIISLKQIITTNNYTEEKKITAYVESAIRYTNDETVNATEEISALDGNITNVDKNKIFDVTFNETLGNNDTINFYLKGINDGSETEIYLCQASVQCSSPGYGEVYYSGSEGWFSITIENLSSPVQSLNIDPPIKVKFDYINATKIILEEYSETNTSYQPSSAVTTEIIVQNLVSWDSLEAEENLNEQTITYDYSTNSGSTWESVPDDKNLTNISASISKIMIKAILNSNGTATPSISFLNLTYTTKEPQKYFEINNTELISIIKDESVVINSTTSKTELNIVASESLSNIQMNISELKDTRSSNISRVKEFEIISPELQDKINTATIKVYYIDEEVENLNESTLKLYYYNETSGEWQVLDSTVNEEENYIQASLQHFSIYGIFGESAQQENTDSSGSTSSGGSGGKKEFTRGTNLAQQQTSNTQEEAEKTTETTQEKAEQETIPTETQTSEESEQLTFTGNAVRIGKVLTEGKVNRSLWILIAILIVAYIIAKIEERK